MGVQHTPGRWAMRDHDDWSVDTPARVHSLAWAAIGTVKRSYPIALVIQRDRHVYGDGRDEHDANLALISAAPDMLAALRKCQSLLDRNPTLRMGGAREAVVAAIAKAAPPAPGPRSEGAVS